jgi:hypothetical protein
VGVAKRRRLRNASHFEMAQMGGPNRQPGVCRRGARVRELACKGQKNLLRDHVSRGEKDGRSGGVAHCVASGLLSSMLLGVSGSRRGRLKRPSIVFGVMMEEPELRSGVHFLIASITVVGLR